MAELWADLFDRPDATGIVAVNNGWGASSGDLDIVSQALLRTGFGYCVFFNPTDAVLPADLRIEVDVILTGGEGATAAYFGVAVKYDDVTQDGIKVLLESWDAVVVDNINIGSSASPSATEPVTLDTTLPVSGWANDGMHTLALEVVGDLCSVFFDGLLVAHANYTPATPGTNIAIVGDPGQATFAIDGVRVSSLDADITATLALVLPSSEISLTADADINSTLALTLPSPALALTADADITTILDLTLPPPAASFTTAGETSSGLSYYTLITDVGQCAVDAINAATPDKELARVCLHVAGQIAFDDCQCGSFTQTAGPWLWSANGRTSSSYIGDDNICGPPYLGLQVTAVVLRCAAQPADDDLAPTCAALDADAQQWHIDSSAMRRGIICCLQAMRAAGTLESFEIVSHVPRGPEGMCVGSELTYRIWLPNCDCG